MDDGLTHALRELAWMRARCIWPNGLRYLWTDAFGVVLLVSLYDALGEAGYLDEAESVVAAVERVLGRARGIRIGEEPDRDGQYFHYLAMWLFALHCLGRHRPRHRARAIELVREIHPRFVIPDVGVVWKMKEDLSAPYPGFGLGALDPFHGYVVYRLLDEPTLAPQISELERLVERTYRALHVTHGVSVGLQAVSAYPERVRALNGYFESYHSNDEYDTNAITHVMACASWFPGALLLKGPRADAE